MKKTKLIAVAGLAAAASMVLTACGGGGSANSNSNSGSAPQEVKFEGKGPITYVQGKDNGGKVQPALIDKWNAAHPDEKVKLIELSSEADQQRQAMVNNAQTKSDAFCVMSVDNVWVSEFAANRWILPLPEKDFPKDEIVKPVWATGEYRGQLYAMPHVSDGGILYYRKDLLQQAGINEPPTTWTDMKSDCEKVRALPGHENIGCYAGQLAKYEGLTVNADEVIHTADGQTVDKDGKVQVGSPEAAKGLKMLSDGIKDGFIPKESLTYKEEEGRNAFESDRLVFYRNWPYQYVLTKEKMGDKFGVVSLPGFEKDKPGVSSLGGHNLGISTFCKNKQTALDFVKWYSAKKQVQTMLDEESLAPIYIEQYKDPKNLQKFPYLTALLGSIENAQPRPQVVNYGDVSAAIQDSAFKALQGSVTADQAVKEMAAKLTELTKSK
ncbi:MAG: ABC transporter substrate-binding protein [Actinomycetaceae bacterium]|nr:ABC transporter substrate-binding protein [Actinomycetaceae bacterium]